MTQAPHLFLTFGSPPTQILSSVARDWGVCDPFAHRLAKALACLMSDEGCIAASIRCHNGQPQSGQDLRFAGGLCKPMRSEALPQNAEKVWQLCGSCRPQPP